MTAYTINQNLYLVSAPVPRGSNTKKPEPQPTNHIVVIDCSGSMYHDLPQIREQLKKKLPVLLGEGDTISIIWFSGRGEFGTLLKGEPVATLKDLNDVNKAIDRWLRPVCLTGFKEPLAEAEKLVDELGGVCSLFFMSDGYDNQWSKQQVLEVVKNLAPKCSSTTFVEYGYYCNHPLMVDMAETAGGALIFSEDFRKYEPAFDAAMQKRAMGAKRIEVDIKADAIRGFAFAMDEGNLMTFKVEGGKVKVPEHIEEIWYLSPSAKNPTNLEGRDFADRDAVYAAISLYAQRVDSEVVLPLLKATGDVRFIQNYSGCFGKQKYAAFTEAALQAVFDTSLRLLGGYDPSAVPDDDAFTVLDLLRILNTDGDNRLLLESKDFTYSKIGRGREQTDDLSEEDQKKVDDLEEKILDASDKDAKKFQKEIDAIKAAAKPLKFEADPIPNGVTINNLVYNETRPNVSVQVSRTGKVNLKARKTKDQKKIPDVFETHIFRNYTIIRDGLLNVEKLPLRLTGGTIRALREAGLPDEAIQGYEGEDRQKAITRIKKAANEREVNVVFDLTTLPIINRTMVKKVSAKELFEAQYKLTQARADQKVYNSYYKEDFGAKGQEGFKVLYGEDGAAWLKEQGITEGGFNPRGKQTAAKDSYVGKELKVALKGLSSIPSLNDFNKRVASGKDLTASQSLMKPAVDAVEAFKASDAYTKSKNPEKVFKAWLEGEQEAAKKKVRELLYQVSQIRFSVIVGQTWFSEFSSLDENSLDLDVGEDKPIAATVEMKEIEVPI